jgi:hypothetical protein
VLYQPKEDYMTDEQLKEAKERGAIFDHALTKAFAYAESGKNTKLIKDGIACDAYLDGFLDGVAFRMGGGHGGD